jgi:hypothetical protein
MAKKVGKPPKYKDGIEKKKLIRWIPVKREDECLKAIEKIVEKDKRTN